VIDSSYSRISSDNPSSFDWLISTKPIDKLTGFILLLLRYSNLRSIYFDGIYG